MNTRPLGLDRLNRMVSTTLARLTRAQGPAEEPTPVYALASPRYDQHLSIPVKETTADARAARDTEARGQFLARQERWDELIDEIREADQTRAVTPGGVPIGELLAFGARSDVVLAAEHALDEGTPSDESFITDAIKSLENMRRDMNDDPYMALVVALTHIDVAWAWHGNRPDSRLPKLHRTRFKTHFDRAIAIMAPFSGLELDSPLIATAQCALLAGEEDPEGRVSDDYEDLIDLDPHNHRHMRALGYHLLPRWFGSYDRLELEARRTAARTQDIWGAGAYAWVNFDAIAMDEIACACLDVEYFIEGLRDIIAARPEQEMINLLAAYCSITIRQNEGESSEADFNRYLIADCADWLIRDHLTEVHPLVWAHALDPFDNNARVSSVNRFAARGRRFALQAIGELFREEINKGGHVTFTIDGPRFDAA